MREETGRDEGAGVRGQVVGEREARQTGTHFLQALCLLLLLVSALAAAILFLSQLSPLFLSCLEGYLLIQEAQA